MKKAMVFVVNVLDKTKKPFYLAEINELDDFYKHICCDCFDVACRTIGNKEFDIFVDDIGLFAENPVVSAITSDGKPMLVGNLLISNHDDDGETTSLTADDIGIILQNIVPLVETRNNRLYFGLTCDYS